MVSLRQLGPLITTLLLVACGADETTASQGEGGGGGSIGNDDCEPGTAPLADGSCLPAGQQPNGCAAGEALLDGTCVAAGDPANGCAPGELVVDGGGCQAAGIPPEACPVGFEPTDSRGCSAILPAQPCPVGEMALPGETTCRPVAPCGTGPWGDIPLDGTTEHVDGSHNGMSNGTASNPWKAIQEGIDAAAPGAIVAIAAGSYAEDLQVAGKAVRLWGKCPAETEVVGASAAVTITAGADGAEVRDLALTGSGVGIDLRGAEQVQIEGVWIHDTAGFGLDARDAPPAATSLTLRGSLVEGATEHGLWLEGTLSHLEDVVVRGTVGTTNHGWGLTVLEDETTFKRATATIRNVVIENNVEVAVTFHAADVQAEAMVIRDTAPNPAQRFGRGLVIQTDPAISEPSNVALKGLVVERNIDVGIMVAASNATIEHCTVRDTTPNLDLGTRGSGIAVQDHNVHVQRSEVDIVETLVERASDAGLFLGGSDVLVEGVAVMDTRTRTDGSMGRGASIQYNPASAQRCNATVRGSLFDSHYDAGLFVQGADVTVQATRISTIVPAPADGHFGVGLAAQAEPSGAGAVVTLTGSVIDATHMAGVHVVGSEATIDRTLIRDTSQPTASQMFGRGINFQDDVPTMLVSAGTVRSTIVERSHEAGVMLAGADVTLEAIVVRDTLPSQGADLGGRGVMVQPHFQTGHRSTATIRWSVIETSVEAGLFVGDSDVVVESTLVRTTTASPEQQLYGDGALVVSFFDTASITLTHSRLETSARAGLAGFGGQIALGGSAVDCNLIDLAGETANGASTTFNDLGGNRCGCGDQSTVCKVLSSMLEAPDPLETY
ncbi:MAG: right-handed parallel beta-helix repeat-containing protein [Deltaproteobacteria bacterium]|nr:right-handed parallel beta-helix repeat-containing protein [Deltaproteobacteria bacterium]